MKNLSEYKEHEIKVLDVDVDSLIEKLNKLGAKEVYNNTRTIIALDTEDKHFLNKEDKLIRVTDEGSIKVTMHVNQSKPKEKEAIKFKTSRLKETLDFFNELGITPISNVKAKRISYELGKIDFDIDKFPEIPAFLEIDTEYIEEEGHTIEEILKNLGLESNKIVEMGTEDIHKIYGIDYFEAYKSKMYRHKLNSEVKVEIWDILDEDGNITGDTINKDEGIMMPKGMYHQGADVWILNSKKEILIQKRAPKKRLEPNLWAMTGGSVIKGESSLDTIKRETKEELGIDLDVEKAIKIQHYKTGNVWLDVYIVEQEVNLNDIIMQEEEVSDVKFVGFDEVEKLYKDNKFMTNRWEFVREEIKKYIEK